jgi:hypothetical protein
MEIATVKMEMPELRLMVSHDHGRVAGTGARRF